MSSDADADVKSLVQLLVTRLASESDRGGLGRALKNSTKLSRIFKEEVVKDVNKIAELSASAISCTKANFAGQRFDSIIDILRLLCVRINAVLKFACRVAATNDDQSLRKWARNLLKAGARPRVAFNSVVCRPDKSQALQVLDAKNLILLGLVTEFFDAASQHVHRFDNAGGKRGSSGPPQAKPTNIFSRIVMASRFAQEVRQRMSRLFDFTAANGERQVPLVLEKNFTRGYVQLVLQGVQALSCFFAL